MHHSELRIACAWQRSPSALIPLQMLIACLSPLLAFVDHDVAVILWPQAARLAAAVTDVLFEVREPVFNDVHTLLSRTPLWGMLAWISSTLGRMICSVNEACSVMLPPFSPTACPRRSCTWPQAGASSSRSP